MNDSKQSDLGVVATKPTNKAGDMTAAESAERRPGAEGNAGSPAHAGHGAGLDVTPGLLRVREAAKAKQDERFTALLHHVTPELLERVYRKLKRKASAGVDGVTWTDYEANLEANLGDLCGRVHRGAYRAQPSRRVFIPKEDGRQRALGIAALEDKIVQGAVGRVLNAIYEADFLGFSYGFRPGRSQQQALDALIVGITDRKVNWILDADIRSFFDTVDHDRLQRLLEQRIGDERVLRLITKWLKAGVLEGAVFTPTEEGTPQGAVISPLLGNVYLHYVFDLWAHEWRSQNAKGDVVMVRYADDIVMGFQYEAEAKRFWDAMRQRFEEYGLSLHPEKTRLLEFGRFAAENREQRKQGKPETFNFLGFTLYCGRTRDGRFQIQRTTRRDRLRKKLGELKIELRQRMHESIADVGQWLASVLTGHFNYYAVWTNNAAPATFRYHVVRLWLRMLRRRSQTHRLTWARMKRITADWLPRPRTRPGTPHKRFYAIHPRREPYARVGLVRICAGGRP